MATSAPYAILRPVADIWVPEVDPRDVLTSPTFEQTESILSSVRTASLVVIDTETKGMESWLPGTEMVGLGLAWVDAAGEMQAKYFDWGTTSADLRREVWEVLLSLKCDVIAHNVPFDSAICSMQADRDFGVPTAWSPENPSPTGFVHRVPFTLCTYGLLRRLASEGWPGQSWSLKSAMTELLGWRDTNEEQLDRWIVSHGYHKVGPKKFEGETPEAHWERVQKWEAENPKRAGRVRPQKGEMWRSPAAILGSYCILDCLATLDLYRRVLRPALNRFPEFEYFHRNAWMDYVRAQCDQQYTGIRVLRHLLVRRRVRLNAAVEASIVEMRAHATLGAAISQWEESKYHDARSKIESREPPRYRKPPKLGKEPKKTTKAGKPSATWIKWAAKRDAIAVVGEGETSKTWRKWKARLDAFDANPPTVNLRSGQTLRKLAYDTGVVVWAPGEDFVRGKRRGSIWINGKFGRVEVDRTKAGALPVSREAVAQFPPDVEAPLTRFLKAQKELTYVEAYQPLLHFHPDRTWRIHPGWIAPGTKTGRLSGKKPSLHQVTKSLELLDCFVPNRGSVWAEMDWSSAEPYTLAEISRDEALLALYGPDANPNHDRYLFTLAKIRHPAMDEVRKYYDVSNPTKEGVAETKSKCKQLRELGKVLCVAEGELVRVRDRGWIPIETVRDGDFVWDGTIWVGTRGAVITGHGDTISVSGVRLTPDHEVLTQYGWKRADEIQEGAPGPQCVRPELPSASWSDVRAMACSLLRDAAAIGLSLCSRVLSARGRAVDAVRQSEVG